MAPENRKCQNCKQNFTIEPEDFGFYEKMQVPPPTWCWKCRAMRRMSFRNFRYIYPRVCTATGKRIFTTLPPESSIPPYDKDYWRSDAWDPMSYGKDYDFSRPFFDQIRELFYAVPFAPIWTNDNVNSDYGISAFMKDCYLCFDSGYSEDSAYGVTLQHSKKCHDTINCKYCELCYALINGSNCYKTFFSRNCDSCTDVWLSSDCTGCSNCFGCAGLRNKNYFIYNQPYSKEDYFKKLEEFKMETWSGFSRAYQKAKEVWLSQPVKYQHSFQAAGCTGDYLYHANQLRNCFFAEGPQNCAHSQSIVYTPIKDSMDVTSSGEGIELDYEMSACGSVMYRTCFSFDSSTVRESQYVINCRNCSDLFGCVALRNKQYCILNKQYTKEEYFALRDKIKKHMDEMPYVDKLGRAYKYGEFFPPEMSPYGYNETQAYEYFQIPKEEAEKMGFNWQEPRPRNYEPTESPKNLPDSIKDVQDGILEEVIRCAHDEDGEHPFNCAVNCPTVFRITAQDLQFYRQMNMPLPRTCFNCRHSERVFWRNPPQLYKRSCMCDKRNHSHQGKCGAGFETSYVPDRPEIVYCESCYNSEIV